MSPMVERVYLAKPRGFCAGVVMAIQAVEKAARELKDQGELVVYHSIVHNDVVVRRLREEYGVHFVEDLAEIEALRKERRLADTVVFSAHGIPPTVRRQAAEMGLWQIDATCPLVTKVHSEAKRYAREGYWILLIGDSADHQEVKGTMGEAPDRTILVAVHTHVGKDPRLADPRTVEVPDPDRVVVLTQTTLSVDDTLETIAILRERFPKLVVPSRDDLCYADQQLLLERDAPPRARPEPGGPRGTNRHRGGHPPRVVSGRAHGRDHLRRLHPGRPGAGGGRVLPRAKPGSRGNRGRRVGTDRVPRAETESARRGSRVTPSPCPARFVPARTPCPSPR